LDAAVGDLANLVTVELGPLGPVVLIEEVDDEDGIDEVDESVAHVTVVLEVNGKVEEVVVVLLGAIDGLKQHLLGVLVRDVLDHDRRPVVRAVQDTVDVQGELVLLPGPSLLHELRLWLRISLVSAHVDEPKAVHRAASALLVELLVLLEEYEGLDLIAHKLVLP
jgi:hypothetical protein